MRKFLTTSMSLALLTAPHVYAQQAATLDDIVVVGADELLSNFLKVSLTVQPGVPLSSINPRAVELEATNTGFFKSAVAELRTENNRDILRVTVVPNPQIREVTIAGTPFLPAADLKRFLEERLNLGAGATLNTVRVEDSKELIAQAYRENGFPFEPGVSAEVREAAEGATLVYTINESAPVTRVEITGATQVPAETLQAAFRPLVDNKQFTPQLYLQALNTIGQAYTDQGLQGSGVDVAATTLADGTLRVSVREARIGQVDTSLLGNVTATLVTRSGGLLNLNTVGQDVRTLSNATGRAVGVNYQADPNNPGVVNVVFGPADVASGPIREVRVAGATLVPVDEIARNLRVRIGDIYAPQIAQEDYLAIQRLYRSRGYEVSTRDPIRFENGVLTYTVREIRVTGYDLRFEGEQRTQDRVILRELPEVGSAFNRPALTRAVGNIARLGFVQPVAEQFVPDPQNPEGVRYVLTLREQRTGIFTPGISYDTLNGFSGDLALSGSNLFGLGHSYSVSVTGAPNDVREFLSASASYTIPWIDIDFLDFRRNRTSLSLNVFSNVNGNNPIYNASGDKTGYEYTQRSTGFGITVGRNLTPNLAANASVSTRYNASRLEPLKSGETATITEAQAQALTPQPGLTTTVGTGLVYDTRDNPEFPSSGLRANTGVSYGFGYQGSSPLSYTQFDAGARTYLGFGRTLDDGTRQQAVAARVDAGTINGSAPANALFRVGGGGSANEAFNLRGYDPGQFTGRNFFTSSLEYRYNFNLRAGFAQGLYGIVFADAGSAWNTGDDFAVRYGYGAGVQLNLGIGNTLLPALRFDYAFSPVNPGGKFSFRLGGFF